MNQKPSRPTVPSTDFEKSLGPNQYGQEDYTTDYEFADGGVFSLQGKKNDDFVVLDRDQVRKLRQRCDEFLHLTTGVPE